MLAPKPMDRLVCGDVGFGKTEVAMRAAFIAVHGGKQVAILVPDHPARPAALQQLPRPLRRLAGDRRGDEPLQVGQGSQRRRRPSWPKARSTSSSAPTSCCRTRSKFNDLGLVIIDEEHRFGVRQKEQLKALRSEVDILTLTATPIPRTLNMAVSGMRDLSIIATPPARRLSVRTFVMEQNKST